MTACTLHGGQPKVEDLMGTDLIARPEAWERQTESPSLGTCPTSTGLVTMTREMLKKRTNR